MEKNHAIGKLRLDIFDKFSSELYAEKKKLIEELEKLEQKLSNPKELLNYSIRLATKLPTAWESSDFYQKQRFQNTLFP